MKLSSSGQESPWVAFRPVLVLDESGQHPLPALKDSKLSPFLVMTFLSIQFRFQDIFFFPCQIIAVTATTHLAMELKHSILIITPKGKKHKNRKF